MTKDIGRLLNSSVPARPAPAQGGEGRELQVDPGELKRLAGPAKETEGDMRSAVHKMVPDSEQGARALGREWSTTARLTELTTGWETALKGLAGQVGDVGPKLAKTAGNHMLVEAINRQAMQGISSMLGD
ncbi:hypothetical protein GCM10023085_47260 [Actinomadura viridis]|uniref:Uncharacterized protein n=1 Tax=Actinomadura viridis TaxID=58110 RepID=A0A931DQB9_9ACTN|nr:hypothetical protein [Actinomadura viridis]MBG6090773.1 hypothetical protein [Actinomadura viridis]